MKIAVFRTNTVLAAWSNWAIPDTLRLLGHDVKAAAMPGSLGSLQISRREYDDILRTMPTIEQLRECDVVIIVGPEYLRVWLDAVYGESWGTLKNRVHLYLESTRRGDVPIRYDGLRNRAEVHCYPDGWDAERFKGYHLRPAVDTRMFCPGDDAKKYDAAFIGSMYPARVKFIQALRPLIGDMDLRLGSVMVMDLSGELKREWTELLIKNIRQSKIHLCLPSNNAHMMVWRPLETMAAGTFCLTNRTPDHPFTDAQCATYDPANVAELAEKLRYYLAHDAEREQIAQAGCEEVVANWSLEKRLTEVLALAGAA